MRHWDWKPGFDSLSGHIEELKKARPLDTKGFWCKEKAHELFSHWLSINAASLYQWSRAQLWVSDHSQHSEGNTKASTVYVETERELFHIYIGVAREGPGSHGAPKSSEYLVILCFERRYPKQNTVARLKSKSPPKIFWPPKILGCLRHCTFRTFCSRYDEIRLAAIFFFRTRAISRPVCICHCLRQTTRFKTMKKTNVFCTYVKVFSSLQLGNLKKTWGLSGRCTQMESLVKRYVIKCHLERKFGV